MRLLIAIVILIAGCTTPNHYLGMDYNTFHQKNTDNITDIVESNPEDVRAFIGTYNYKDGKRVKIGWGADAYGIFRIGYYIVYDGNNDIIVCFPDHLRERPFTLLSE